MSEIVDGYSVWICSRGRRIINIDGKKIYYARYVMGKHLGRELRGEEHVHHKDENKLNDDIENLQVMSSADHVRLHHNGTHHSAETRRKMSEAKKGKFYSAETRRKMSAARSGKKNGMYGRTHSESTKMKMSKAKKGKFPSAETRRKMSKSTRAHYIKSW